MYAWKITNNINTEIYDLHYPINYAVDNFVAKYGKSEVIIIKSMTREEYITALEEKRLSEVIEQKRKEVKFI